MGTSSTWRFALVTVALLLDPAKADIMVQPGYGNAGSGQESFGNSQSMGNPPMVQQPPQMQQYSNSQNPTLQFLQQQHALQRNYLQQKHQDQHQQLLGLQHQELKHAAMQSPQGSSPGNEVVGNIWGYPSLLPGLGGLHTGNLFSLGPLGLNDLALGGLGGFGLPPPLLMATHQNQQPQTAESTQPKSSVDKPESRARREVRDSGDAKRYRQKQSRPQHDGGANPTVKSKSDTAAPQNTKSSKSNGDIVGDVHQEEDNDENVGSPGGVFDPLNLMDKAETLIDDLRTGNLPNPMDILNQGGGGSGLLPGFPNWLNAANPQAMVGQPQQYTPYPMQDQYTMMNQQRSQSQQPSGPMVGNMRHQMIVPRPPVYGSYGPYGAARYGAYGSPYQMYFQPHSPMGPWARHSNLMNYPGSPMIGAANPAAQDSIGKMSSGNPNGYQQQMAGAANPMNPITGDKAQPGTENAGAPMNTMNGGPVVGASNPTVGRPYPGSYYQMMPAQNQMATYYQSGRNAQQGMGTNPTIGSPGPGQTSAATPQSPPIVGGPNRMGGQMNQFYDTDGQYGFNNFDGDFQKHRHPGFDLDDIFDGGYGHAHGGINTGSYDRIYETTSVHNGRPYGYGGSMPYHTHNHQHSYII